MDHINGEFIGGSAGDQFLEVSDGFDTHAVNGQQLVADLAVDMPSPASTMNGALPLVATLLFLVIPITLLLILFIKNPGPTAEGGD